MQLEDLVGGPCVVFKNHDVLCFLPRYRLPTQRNQPGRFIHDPMRASQLVASWTTIGLLGGDHASYNQQVLMFCNEACMARLSRLEDLVFLTTTTKCAVWSVKERALSLLFEVPSTSRIARWVGDSFLAIQYDHQSVRVFDRHGASRWVPSFKVAVNHNWVVFVEGDMVYSFPACFSHWKALSEDLSKDLSEDVFAKLVSNIEGLKQTKLGGRLAVMASRGNQHDSFVVVRDFERYSFDAQTHVLTRQACPNLKLT